MKKQLEFQFWEDQGTVHDGDELSNITIED